MKFKIVYLFPTLGAFWALFELSNSIRQKSISGIKSSVLAFFFNFLFSFLLFAFISSPFFMKEQKVSRVKQNLNSIDSLLRMYVSFNGELPNNLDHKNVLFVSIYIYDRDPFINPIFHNNQLFYKKLDRYRYIIKSVGPDGKLNTSDDIVKISTTLKH